MKEMVNASTSSDVVIDYYQSGIHLNVKHCWAVYVMALFDIRYLPYILYGNTACRAVFARDVSHSCTSDIGGTLCLDRTLPLNNVRHPFFRTCACWSDGNARMLCFTWLWKIEKYCQIAYQHLFWWLHTFLNRT